MDAKEQLRREIETLEKQIEARRRALEALQLGEARSGDKSLRFFRWRPLDATRELLREKGAKMKREDILKALLEGGIAVDRKRKGHNVTISMDKNIALGNLVALKDGYIDLPERHPKAKSK